MSSENIAIRVHNLGKRYTIGGPQERYLTLRDAIVNSVKAPFHRILHKNSDQSVNEFWALKDVTFDVEHGEVVGIIGRNGAGKSTLLKILSRITSPTEGMVELHGRVGSLLEVGTGFHPEMTGRENIFLNGSILGMKKVEIEQKFDEIVKFAEIDKFIDTPVKRYSSGMYVRLAFAVAAHLDPEILVVDEVLAVGDAEFQKKCLGKMKDISKGGRTVLFVSHQMSAVENLCSRVLFIESGQIKADGPSNKIVQLYLHRSPNTYVIGDELSSNTNRSGTGELRYNKIWFTDKNGNSVSDFREGMENVNFHALLIPTSKILTAKKCVGTICFRDFTGYRLFTMASSIKGIVFSVEGPTEICWTMKKMLLTEGNYICDVYLGDPLSDTPIDYILNAFELEIYPGDFFKTGRSQGKGLDKLYIDFDISINPITTNDTNRFIEKKL